MSVCSCLPGVPRNGAGCYWRLVRRGSTLLAKGKYPKIAPGLRLVHPQDTEQYFAYRPDTGARYEVNEVSFRMMEMMNGNNEVGVICSAIRQEFSGADSVAGDLEILLQQLVQEGCVIIEEK